MQESERHIESVQSALRLLSCFERDVPLRLEDMHERTGLTRSRIIRMAGTLVHEGFLVHEPKTGRYLLGPNLYRLGSLLEQRYGSFKETVRLNLTRLVDATGYTAMFSVISGQDRLILAKEEPDLDLRFTVREGQCRPITAGATGRVILAFAAADFRMKVLKNCDLSDEDVEQLENTLKTISAAGYEFSRSELTKHAFALAVPVLDASQKLIGALTLAGPAAAYEQTNETHLITALREEAEILARTACVGAMGRTAAPIRQKEMMGGHYET